RGSIKRALPFHRLDPLGAEPPCQGLYDRYARGRKRWPPAAAASIGPRASSAARQHARADGPRLALAHPPSRRCAIPHSGDRVNGSFCTFLGVHSGLAMGSIYLDGSEEQKQKWLPAMARWEKIGCFGLTEPLVGSGTSGGMTTTAKREGDSWILNGQKRWIGNATWCDVSIIW